MRLAVAFSCGETRMNDVLMVALTLVFFGLACERV
jgi:hypothetical protein